MANDYWVHNLGITDTTVKFNATQLSTWETTAVEVDRVEFKSQLLTAYAPLSASAIEDGILEFDKKWKLKNYVGNLKTDIISDVHEPSKVTDVVGLRPTSLYSGDYLFKTATDSLVVIERKRLENGELINCFMKPSNVLESKLTSQARRMQTVGDINILLVDLGAFMLDRPTGKIRLPKAGKKNKFGKKDTLYSLRFVDLQKHLRSLHDAWGIYTWLSYDEQTVAEDIIEIREYFNKGKHSSQTVVEGFIPSSDIVVYPAAVQSLCFIGGMGPILASRALKHFGSLRKAVSASVLEWQKVEGIGTVRSNGIVKELTKEFK